MRYIVAETFFRPWDVVYDTDDRKEASRKARKYAKRHNKDMYYIIDTEAKILRWEIWGVDKDGVLYPIKIRKIKPF